MRAAQLAHDAMQAYQRLAADVVEEFPVQRTLVHVASESRSGHAPVLREFLAGPEHGDALRRIQRDDVRLHLVEPVAIAESLAEEIPQGEHAALVDESRVIVRLDVLKSRDGENITARVVLR